MDVKDYKNSFFFNQSSEVYAKYYAEINFIGNQIKTPEMYKEYIMTKSLQMQVEKVQKNLITSIASKIIRQKSLAVYGKSLPKCKLFLDKVLSFKEPSICISDEMNPATQKGAKFWAELFLEQNSKNNTKDSPQYKRLDLLSSKTGMRKDWLMKTFVKESAYSGWVREIIEALATQKIYSYGCSKNHNKICTLE